VAATVEQFKLIFLEFSQADDDRIQYFLDQALPYVNKRDWGVKYDYAHALWTAHLMKSANMYSVGGLASTSSIEEEKLGDLTVKFGDSETSKTTFSTGTYYGDLFMRLLRTVQFRFRVV
jgi:ABC-type sulfate transport system substrate-binding protein